MVAQRIKVEKELDVAENAEAVIVEKLQAAEKIVADLCQTLDKSQKAIQEMHGRDSKAEQTITRLQVERLTTDIDIARREGRVEERKVLEQTLADQRAAQQSALALLKSSKGGRARGGGGDDDDGLYIEDPPDRTGGLVPPRLHVNDDAWSVIDALQKRIDRLRDQVTVLGAKPRC